MRKFLLLPLLIATMVFTSCSGQTRSSGKNSLEPPVGGAFENSEFTYYAIPKTVNATDTSPGWHQPGQKILLTGTVYQNDGRTPAPGVLLYYYHTNTEGRYLHKPEEKRSMPPNSLGQTHGYIRGWVQTDAEGRYFIYTVRPGTYPTRDEPDPSNFPIAWSSSCSSSCSTPCQGDRGRCSYKRYPPTLDYPFGTMACRLLGRCWTR
ncbi:MAG: hypothetical protein EOO38_26730 [Cytophagaceae bacterium]|nr:MAG: hypothetical protein EOO38_26730 [Cytophagaceae bacterium]